jgi:hypothetical protein
MGRLTYTSTNRSSETIQVKGVLVDPTGAWQVVIQDSAGKTVFAGRGDGNNSFFAAVDDTWDGANCTTATNVGTIIIYTE